MPGSTLSLFLEGILELKKEYALSGEEVAQVDIEIFDVAYHIIGGGEEKGIRPLSEPKRRRITACLT